MIETNDDMMRWLRQQADMVSNMHRPLEDNHYGRAFAEITSLRTEIKHLHDVIVKCGGECQWITCIGLVEEASPLPIQKP